MTNIDRNAETKAIITEAHKAVTVTGADRKRALRNAAIDAVIKAYGPFTVREEIKLSETDPKFAAWVTGARGRNGWLVSGKMGAAIVGLTTVQDFIERGAITNPEAVTGKVTAPVIAGVISQISTSRESIG